MTKAVRAIAFEDDMEALAQAGREAQRARVAALRAKRRERAERLLRAWQTRAKRANTMVRKLRRTVDYYKRTEGGAK